MASDPFTKVFLPGTPAHKRNAVQRRNAIASAHVQALIENDERRARVQGLSVRGGYLDEPFTAPPSWTSGPSQGLYQRLDTTTFAAARQNGKSAHINDISTWWEQFATLMHAGDYRLARKRWIWLIKAGAPLPEVTELDLRAFTSTTLHRAARTIVDWASGDPR